MSEVYYWIEEGTYEDFKQCILNSELPALHVATQGTAWRADRVDYAAGTADMMAYGTFVITHEIAICCFHQVGAHIGHMAFARINQPVIEMLMQRPEVKPQKNPVAKAIWMERLRLCESLAVKAS